MIVTGKYTDDLKRKAIREISQVMDKIFIKDFASILKLTSLSWYHKTFKIKPIKFKKEDKYFEIPEFLNWEIIKIIFHSGFVIEVFIYLDQKEVYTFKMLAERKPFKVDAKKPFGFIPDTFVYFKDYFKIHGKI
jgi:hypothetical protein